MNTALLIGRHVTFAERVWQITEVHDRGPYAPEGCEMVRITDPANGHEMVAQLRELVVLDGFGAMLTVIANAFQTIIAEGQGYERSIGVTHGLPWITCGSAFPWPLHADGFKAGTMVIRHYADLGQSSFVLQMADGAA